MALSEGQTLRVVARMQGTQSQDIINVWHTRCTTLVDGTPEDVVDDIAAKLSSNYQLLKSVIAQTQVSQDLSVVNVSNGEVYGTHAWTTPFAGTATGEELPPQMSLFSYFRTGYSRRVGRKFWGITAEALADAGLTVASVATTMGTFLASWLGPWTGSVTGNTYYWGVYNPNFVLQFLDFTEALYTSRMMVQRRRRPQVGS